MVQTQKNSLKESSWFGGPKCKLGSKVAYLWFSFFSIVLFYHCYSNFVKMENMLWIKDIVKRTLTPPFLTNSRVDMVDFVNLHKVVTRRNAFLDNLSA